MKLVYLRYLSLVLILVGLLLLFLGTRKTTLPIQQTSQVYVQADGKAKTLLSFEQLPANLLALAGVPLFPGDQLLSDGQPIAPDQPLSPTPVHSIQVRRAIPVYLTDGSQVETIKSSAVTLGQALWEAGVQLYAADQLVPTADTILNKPLNAEFRRSGVLYIYFQEGEVSIRTSEEFVGAALAEAGLPLEGLDYSQPPADSPLPANGRVRVVRVRESVALETEPLPYETQFQPAPDLEIDNQKVLRVGKYGLTSMRIRIRHEDGREVSRQIEGEYVAQQPQARIIGYGTKIVPRTTDTPDGRIRYWRALNMHAVSYNPTSAGGNTTASGLPLQKGVVAVDPTYISLGTRLYIPGYGHAVAADIGGGVQGRIIDLGYSDADYVPWSKWVTVYFLWPPPQNVAWIIP